MRSIRLYHERIRKSKAILNCGGSFSFIVLFLTRTVRLAYSMRIFSIRPADCNSSNCLSTCSCKDWRIGKGRVRMGYL